MTEVKGIQGDIGVTRGTEDTGGDKGSLACQPYIYFARAEESGKIEAKCTVW